VYQFDFYSYVLFITTVIASTVIFFLWRHRHNRAAVTLMYLQLAIAIWAFAIAFEAAATGLELKLFWSKVAYLGTTTTPLFYALFTFAYSREGVRLSKRKITLLSVIPALVIIFAFTNDLHGWIWPSVRILPGTNIAMYEHGPFFWLFVVYAYVMFSVGMFIIARPFFRVSSFYRRHIIILLVGSLLPFAGNLVYVSGLNPLPGVDWTPIAFGLAGVILALGMFQLKMFELMPVAHNLLLKNMQAGVLVLDEFDRIIDLNPSIARILNLPESQPLIGLFVHEIFPAGLLAGLDNMGDKSRQELLLEGDDELVLEINISPIYETNSQVIGRLVVLNDITCRKNAEAALREINTNLEQQVAARTAEIRAEKEKAETILRNVGDGIMLTDLDLRIQYVNDAFCRLSGYDPEELNGLDISTTGFSTFSGKSMTSIMSMLEWNNIWQGEVLSVRKNGRKYDANVTVSLVREALGKPSGYVFTCRDVSHLKELTKARNRFMTNVSHELRTPVTNIKLFSELLQAETDSENQDQYRRYLVEQAERLEGFMESIFELTALDSRSDPMNWEKVAIPSLIQDVMVYYAKEATRSQIQLLHRENNCNHVVVKGNPARLHQALAELVKNALYFSPTGTRIHLGSEQIMENGKPWIGVYVVDEGPGIDPQEQERIFERFYRGQVAEPGHIPGTGLGLSIVQEIVSVHGGKVTVESNPPDGSRFTIWLKAFEPEQQDMFTDLN